MELVVDHQFVAVMKRAAGHPFGAPRIAKTRDWPRERLYWAAVYFCRNERSKGTQSRAGTSG